LYLILYLILFICYTLKLIFNAVYFINVDFISNSMFVFIYRESQFFILLGFIRSIIFTILVIIMFV
jgi:hypothetical protein